MVTAKRQPFYQLLYVQVLLGVALGIVVGCWLPSAGRNLKPLGDGFIALIKMLIAPLIFCTVVHGIASLKDLKKLGRIGCKTLLYFEAVSTLALMIGLIVVNLLKPGEGFPTDAISRDPKLTQSLATKAQELNAADFVLHIIPTTFFSPFVSGDLLQILLVSLLCALAVTMMGERGQRVIDAANYGNELFQNVLRIVVRLAPIGAFGAMAYTIGTFGLKSLNQLLALMAGFYLTAGCFVVFVLGAISMVCGFSIFRFLGYIKQELFLVLGTSSSETALPGIMQRMRELGCSATTVGLVIPTGYSFNLDGTNIYMSMAAIFLAQATHTPLDLKHQLILLTVAMVTSKGASGVTGAGFVTLAATLAAVPGIPIESLALLVGIDRFMSECRALTNLIGNGVATIAISRWEREVSAETIRANLRIQSF